MKTSTIQNKMINNIFLKSNRNNRIQSSYEVIHPIFDIPEEKVDTNNAAPLHMTKSVKWSLISLRVYLIVMLGLSVYRSLVLAGFIK
ncbi:MAG TPA: hypothetical protein VHP12_05530 [Chitinophagaceae bacterium]|nr:hypothetical protein [Chitinophagaceae bacterium]